MVHSRGTYLVWVVSALPLIGLFTCVTLTVLKDFEASTRTHCQVRNILPSISAAIGDFSPQQYIWTTCILLHSGPRLLSPLLIQSYFSRFTESSSEQFGMMVCLSGFVHFVEVVSLVILSYFTSSTHYIIHSTAFYSFIVTSIISISLQLILRRWAWKWQTMPMPHSYHYKNQKRLFLAYLACIGVIWYMFVRHERYCEAYVYSIFAGFEYLLVVVNISLNCYFGTESFGWFESERQATDKRLRHVLIG